MRRLDVCRVPLRKAFPPCKCSFGLALYSAKGNKIIFPFLVGPDDCASEVRTQG